MRSSSLDHRRTALGPPVLFVALALLAAPAPASAVNPDFEVTFTTNGEIHNIGEFYPEGVMVEWKGWGGKRLEIKWKFKASGFTIKAKETWKSRDANLLLERVFVPPLGPEFKQKLIFVRPKK